MDTTLANPVTVTTPAPATKSVWTGRVLSGLVVAFLLFDGVIKFFPIAPVVEATARLGWDVGLAPALGVLLLACTALYAIPRTRTLGAILLTAYLGGATATHVRIGDPFFFPPLMGVILWVGLYLRDARLRALLAR
jgi:hypothetical protein